MAKYPHCDCGEEPPTYGVAPSEAPSKPEWNGSCVLGHCGSPSGCERDDRCRADPTFGVKACRKPNCNCPEGTEVWCGKPPQTDSPLSGE